MDQLNKDNPAIESHSEGLLSRTVPGNKCFRVSLKIVPETRTWVQVVYLVYLECDPTKHKWPSKKSEIAVEEEPV